MEQKIYLGSTYYPEHWPRERWPEDIRLMKEAGVKASGVDVLTGRKVSDYVMVNGLDVLIVQSKGFL